MNNRLDRLNFGERLQMLRENRGLDVREACKLSGVSNNMMRYYESGKSEPTVHVIIALCKAFDVSADVLLGLDEPECINTHHSTG